MSDEQAVEVAAEPPFSKDEVEPEVASPAAFDDEEDARPVATNDFGDFDPALYPMRKVEFCLPCRLGTLSFNHVTSFIGFTFLWAVAIWCMTKPDESLEILIDWRGKSALYFTWFYIGTRPIFLFFFVYLAIKYGHVRLGKNDEKPEFDDLSYFAMLFAAGVAVGLFFFGVSEPLWHQSSHWFSNPRYHSQDEVDLFAMNLCLYHWGFAAWAGYLIPAVCIGMAAYRYDMPLTFRSGFYPMLGDYTWGWLGDCIDGFTIVVTVAGICTSLGLGAIQIAAGFQRLEWVDSDLTEDELTNIQIYVIIGITAIATASVISGLHIGIKYLSDIAFVLGLILLFWVFCLESTKYQLNLFVQVTGYHLQWSIFQIQFWTDAFGQLRLGEGRATDGKAAAGWWMDAWTVFYMAWWTSWSGFVGLFIARISRGRTIRSIVFWSLVLPFFFCAIWFCIFGGSGMRQQRQALELIEIGNSTFGDPEKWQNSDFDYCYDVPQEPIFDSEGNAVFTNYLEGITPVCLFNTKDSNNAWFNMLYSFSFPNDFDVGYGPFFSIVSIFALALYFITSSDSGSLIVDHLASNGASRHHWMQRFFWAVTEGAVAIALLVAGGSKALSAVQAASIIAGLPFTFFLCYFMQSIHYMCVEADKGAEVLTTMGNGSDFKTPCFGGIFNVFEFLLSFGFVHDDRREKGMDMPTMFQTITFFKSLFIPFVTLYEVLTAFKSKPAARLGNIIKSALYAAFFFMWIGFFASVGRSASLAVFGWSAYVVNGVILSGVKYDFRKTYNINGDTLGDVLTSFFLWPQVLTQLKHECIERNLPRVEDDAYEVSMEVEEVVKQ